MWATSHSSKLNRFSSFMDDRKSGKFVFHFIHIASETFLIVHIEFKIQYSSFLYFLLAILCLHKSIQLIINVRNPSPFNIIALKSILEFSIRCVSIHFKREASISWNAHIRLHERGNFHACLLKIVSLFFKMIKMYSVGWLVGCRF